MLEIALQIILCLLLASILGFWIGNILGKCMGELRARRDIMSGGATAVTSSTKKSNSNQSHDKEEPLYSRRPEIDHLIVAEEPNQELTVDTVNGEQPMSLTAARNGQKDKLTRIRGVGVKMDDALNDIGIFHFDQIASWTDENVDWIENNIAFPGRVKREQWVAQAKILASGKATGFSKRVDNGEVASSIRK